MAQVLPFPLEGKTGRSTGCPGLDDKVVIDWTRWCQRSFSKRIDSVIPTAAPRLSPAGSGVQPEVDPALCLAAPQPPLPWGLQAAWRAPSHAEWSFLFPSSSGSSPPSRPLLTGLSPPQPRPLRATGDTALPHFRHGRARGSPAPPGLGRSQRKRRVLAGTAASCYARI